MEDILEKNETLCPKNGASEVRWNEDDENGEETCFSVQNFKKNLLNKHLPYGWIFCFNMSCNNKPLEDRN